MPTSGGRRREKAEWEEVEKCWWGNRKRVWMKGARKKAWTVHGNFGPSEAVMQSEPVGGSV